MSADAASRAVVVVTGGIAAYKSCEVVRRLRDQGIEVRVAMTRAATEFVTPATFAALSGNSVVTSLFRDAPAEDIAHVRWAEWADLVCVVPATADFLAKMAHGVADDFASTLCLANTAPVLVAPAMEDDMYRHPAVQRNLAALQSDGVAVVGPAEGALASGRSGPGRMSDPNEIVAAAVRVIRRGVPARDLGGESVVITAGPTWEPVDPVRGLTNRSSGRMGYALAREAVLRGADVVLVSGPTSLPAPAGAAVVCVGTAREMHDAVMERIGVCDVAVMCAAVADFTPGPPAEHKVGKIDHENGLTLELQRTRDILADIATLPERPFLVGFAAESRDVEERAAAKLARKGCDLIVANAIGDGRVGMGGEDNAVVVLDRQGVADRVERAPKAVVAGAIWDAIARARAART